MLEECVSNAWRVCPVAVQCAFVPDVCKAFQISPGAITCTSNVLAVSFAYGFDLHSPSALNF